MLTMHLVKTYCLLALPIINTDTKSIDVAYITMPFAKYSIVAGVKVKPL